MDVTVTETFKPIIEPLNETQNSTSDKNIQTNVTYNPKLQPNKIVRLGKIEIKLVGNTLIVDDTIATCSDSL
ncbi:Uncharacterized protein FWK35_00024341 [Aphis craccivora]|uniref:Uncharacterized protein n=1 Tax=Aphis craccivora TaxID=307492 RepID=A0A6G0W1W8_APHCR|nr:Uncharacterized protein FWK35_00024341 [Aphis craccivora]